MQLKSTVNEARPGSDSRRTTIPQGIVAYLDVELGDKLVWIMDGARGGPREARVIKATAKRS